MEKAAFNKKMIFLGGKDQLDALFLNVFSSCLYMFRAASAHHQEGELVLIHNLV
jgi:hypothetical protein